MSVHIDPHHEGPRKSSPVIDPETDLTLSHRIGSGRHGTVFLASCRAKPPSPGFDVAVKIPTTGTQLPAAELEALGRFRHANIVAFLAGPTGQGAIVLELCAMGTLADLVAEKRHLPSRELSLIASGVIDALRAIHADGWIHGDVSPANIGIRADGSPALLDFATARPADGTPVAEGTLEFAGPNRQAEPAIDIRSLAASVLWALGPVSRWNREPEDQRHALEALIVRLDNGEAVRLDELERIVGVDATRAVPITRDFGPQPPRKAAAAETNANRPRWAIAVLVLTAMLLTASELGRHDSVNEPQNSVTAPPTGPTIAAADTFAASDVVWDDSTGILVRADGERLRVGRPGDMAAVADWSCSGRATLGVYRPSTGSWFVFDSWDPGSLSTEPVQLGVGASRLSVGVDAAGCADPKLW